MYAYQIVFYRSGVEVVKVSKEARKQHFLRSFKVWRRKKPKKSSVSFSFVLITFCHNKKSRHSLLYFSRPIIKILFHSKRDLHFFFGGGELNAQSSHRPNSVTRLVVYVYSLGHLQQ